jgi:hypothetical protein
MDRGKIVMIHNTKEKKKKKEERKKQKASQSILFRILKTFTRSFT